MFCCFYINVQDGERKDFEKVILSFWMIFVIVEIGVRRLQGWVCLFVGCFFVFYTQVYMGTYMWNNVFARRGRRLFVENFMVLLGGDVLKFSEMFQKDLVARVMNVDFSFWNQYVVAIINGFVMKNNEIFVIQNGGIFQLLVSLGGSVFFFLGFLIVGMDKVRIGSSSFIVGLDKVNFDTGISRSFTRFIEDNKEIGINQSCAQFSLLVLFYVYIERCYYQFRFFCRFLKFYLQKICELCGC